MTEKFNLSWHTFKTHTNELLSELYFSSQFSDVTLICHDQTQFKAHKFILSTCSSVFRNILSQNDQVPFIYLRGIAKEDVESVLQFMYLGEATLHQERMNNFLDVARDLDVKEIGNSVDVDDEETATSDKMTESFEDTDDISNDFTVNNQNTHVPAVVTDSRKYQCQQCDYKATQICNLNIHIKSKHEGMRYPCQQCDYEATTPGDVNKHVKSKHEGIRLPCQHCHYKAYDSSSLLRHIRSKHEGIRYPCQQCDFKATQQNGLIIHVKSKHEGIRYPCQQCEFKATSLSILSRHVKVRHEGLRYPCQQCDFKATEQSKLNRHVQSIH